MKRGLTFAREVATAMRTRPRMIFNLVADPVYGFWRSFTNS